MPDRIFDDPSDAQTRLRELLFVACAIGVRDCDRSLGDVLGDMACTMAKLIARDPHDDCQARLIDKLNEYLPPLVRKYAAENLQNDAAYAQEARDGRIDH